MLAAQHLETLLRTMEERCLSLKHIYTSKLVLVKESISISIPLSLTTLIEQLPKDATRHDCLVALLLILFVESGFCIMHDPGKYPIYQALLQFRVYRIHISLHRHRGTMLYTPEGIWK